MSKPKDRPNLDVKTQWKKLVYNTMYENDFVGLKKEQLYPLVQRLSKMSITRRNKFKKFYEQHDIPLPIAYKDIGENTKTGMKMSYLNADFSVSPDMNINELRQKFRLLRGYLRTKTSTQRGWEKTIDDISDKLIYSTVSKYKTINGVNVKKTKKELDNELAQKRIDFKNRFKENIGREYYADNGEKTTFYDVMWRIYNRVSESGLVRSNITSETIKLIYDTMEESGQTSMNSLIEDVLTVLKEKDRASQDNEDITLKKVLEDAGMDTELFFDIGDNK